MPLAPLVQEQLLAEARAASALDHPHVCTLHGVGDSAAGPFLIMPWYDGETLRDRLSRGCLPLLELLRIASELASGVAAAHAAGIVHRDIKPGNVMLLRSGQVKLLDFGLARHLTTSRDLTHGMGTRGYMAPEQCACGEVSTPADLWAIGAVMREMAGGHDLRGGSRLPADLTALVDRLMAPNPDQRAPSAAELSVRLAARLHAERMNSERRIRRSRFRRRVMGTSIAFAAAGISVPLHHVSVTSFDRGTAAPLVLADMQVTGADHALSRFGTRVLRASLEQSRDLALVSQERVDSTQRRMRRVIADQMDNVAAREVARRIGARGVIETHLSTTASSQLLAASVTDPQSGTTRVNVFERVGRNDAELAAGIRRLADRLADAFDRSALGAARGAPPPSLTTASETALQSFQKAKAFLHTDERRATLHLRQAVRTDSAFVYAYVVLANGLSALPVRTAERDSALSRSVRFGHGLTLMEQSQANGFHAWLLALDRQRARETFEAAIAEDPTQIRAAMNLTTVLLEQRAFAEAERVVMRYRGRDSVPLEYVIPSHVRALIGQGRTNEARTVFSAYLEKHPAFGRSITAKTVRRELATASHDYTDSTLFDASPRFQAAITRIAQRHEAARRWDDRADSALARALDNHLVEYRPGFRRAVTDAASALWVERRPDRAIARLDRALAERPLATVRETQDRLDALHIAALYAAAGAPTRARAIRHRIVADAQDTLVRRALRPSDEQARGEIALAEGRFRAAYDHFRRSDSGADGLPVNSCTVCVLPLLARTLDRAGETDSARVLWTRYLAEPSLDRLMTDQWYLALAHERTRSVTLAVSPEHPRR